MTKENKVFNPNIKTIHILILGCFLCFVVILNSNYVNNKKAEEKLYREKSRLFEKIVFNRVLQETPGESKINTGTDKVCKKGSKELNEYYETGDLTKIGLKDEPIKCEEKGKPYFDALIRIIKEVAGEDEKKENDNSSSEGESTSGENRPNLRNLEFSFDTIKDDIITYAKHIIPIVIFLVIGILCLPGWLVCCFCCCCNCCCCCCCKKPNCKIPCFIFTYVFYALSIAICIYGLAKSNSIFVGFANTECSLLKFFDQVLEGEMKQELPRWAGIEEINNILNDIKTQIEGLEKGVLTRLNSEVAEIKVKKSDFKQAMDLSSNSFFDENNNYIDDYSVNYNFNHGNRHIVGRYVLDIVKMFGKRKNTEDKYLPENSILDLWQQEYTLVAEEADKYLADAQKSFNTMIGDNTRDITEKLQQGQDALDELRGTFEDYKSEIADTIIDSSDMIDEYGKLGFKAIFGVLGLMNIALAVFVLFICFFSGKLCTNCCCCRCLFKFFTHLFWNILALLMFITFLFGFILSFLGTVGSDAMSVISYVVSSDNLKEDGDGFLVDKLKDEDARKYLHRCINLDGKIEKELNLNLTQVNSLDIIRNIEDSINDVKAQFEEKLNFYTYNIYKEQLEARVNFSSREIMLVEQNTDIKLPFEDSFDNAEQTDKYLIFKLELQLMNQMIRQSLSSNVHKNEQWDMDSTDTNNKCYLDEHNTIKNQISGSTDSLNPKVCQPFYREWINSLNSEVDKPIKNEALILKDTLEFIDNANQKVDNVNKKSFSEILDDLKIVYETFLRQYIKALDGFSEIIGGITGRLNQYINDNDGIFAFIKGTFIGTNLKVILKYLKSALGTDIKTVGVCLTVVGCSLALSISSTILLIVVINIDIDNNKKELERQKNAPEYNLNQDGRVIQYQ